MKQMRFILATCLSILFLSSCDPEYEVRDWSQPSQNSIALACQVKLSADEMMTWPESSQIGLYCPQIETMNQPVSIAASTVGADVGKFYTGLSWGDGEHAFTAYWPYSETSTQTVLSGTMSNSILQNGASAALNSQNTYIGKVKTAEQEVGEFAELTLKPLFETCKITLASSRYAGFTLDRVYVKTNSGAPVAGSWSYTVSNGKFAYTEGSDELTVNVSGVQVSDTPSEVFFLTYDAASLSEESEFNVVVTNDQGSMLLKGTALLTAATTLNIDSFISTIVGDDSINLADPDNDGFQETANCYVAGQPGMTYRFPATIMGNGKTTAPAPDTFAPSSGTAPGIIPSPLSPKSAQLLWQTDKALITNVMLKNGCVYFTLNGEEGGELTPGNAVIAVYSDENAAGMILWSWHIWVTAADLDGNLQTWTVHSDLKNYSAYQNPQLMDRNLGALESSGWEITGTNLDHGLIYQWGRKDPFVGADDSKWGSVAMRKTYDCNGNEIGGYEAAATYSSAAKWTYVDKVHLKREDLGKYPMAFYYSGSTKNNQFWMDAVYHDLWGCPDYGKESNNIGEKTIYDPCPPGYRVMNAYAMTGATTKLAGGAFTAVASGSNLVNYSDFSAKQASLQVKYDGVNTTYLPANGITFFEKVNFPVTRTGGYGYLWSASMTSGFSMQAYRLHFDTKNFNSMGKGYASYGHGVRCERIR